MRYYISYHAFNIRGLISDLEGVWDTKGEEMKKSDLALGLFDWRNPIPPY